MSFDIDYFSSMAYGGKQGTTFWHYYDVNNDNLSSMVMGKVYPVYFSRAFTDHGIKARLGDLIFVTTPWWEDGILSHNGATPACLTFIVSDAWDANGASVVRTCGPMVA